MSGNITESDFEQKIGLASYIIIILENIIGLILNSATVYVILRYPKLKTPSNQLILGMAFGDLLICSSLVCTLVMVIYKTQGEDDKFQGGSCHAETDLIITDLI